MKLKRALTELAVVSLGVFAALLADNWTTVQGEKALEGLYLQNLITELEGDSVSLGVDLPDGMDRKFRAYAAVAPYVRGEVDEIGDTLAFLANIGMLGAFGLSPMEYNRSTWEELQSTGNLRVFRSDALRPAIVRYYDVQQAQQKRMASRMAGYPLQVHALIPAEARDSLSLDLLRTFGLERALTRVRSEEFLDAMNREMNYAWFVRRMQPALSRFTNEMLRDVRAELAK